VTNDTQRAGEVKKRRRWMMILTGEKSTKKVLFQQTLNPDVDLSFSLFIDYTVE